MYSNVSYCVYYMWALITFEFHTHGIYLILMDPGPHFSFVKLLYEYLLSFLTNTKC